MLRRLFQQEGRRRQALASGFVMPEAGRCVQCGICSYNCPLAIDVREHARLGRPIDDGYCLTCGECVARCPRGVLRFETAEVVILEARTRRP